MNQKTVTKPEVKPVEKAVEAKAVEAKVETKTVEAKPAETKLTAEKPVKAEPVKKEAPKKKAGRKPAAKKEENKTEVFVEFYGQQSAIEDVKKKITDSFVAEGHRASTIKSLKIYLKPEDHSAYYVINEKFAGRVDLF